MFFFANLDKSLTETRTTLGTASEKIQSLQELYQAGI